jgi:hypothetical protein
MIGSLQDDATSSIRSVVNVNTIVSIMNFGARAVGARTNYAAVRRSCLAAGGDAGTTLDVPDRCW